MTPKVNWFLEAIRHEVEKLEGNRFTGSIGFKINFKSGTPVNMNVELNKSVWAVIPEDK